MENWYAPGEVRTHQMSDEEKQLYEERRRKRYPWETKKSKRDLDAHHIGAHRSPLFMWKRKWQENGSDLHHDGSGQGYTGPHPL